MDNEGILHIIIYCLFFRAQKNNSDYRTPFLGSFSNQIRYVSDSSIDSVYIDEYYNTTIEVSCIEDIRLLIECTDSANYFTADIPFGGEGMEFTPTNGHLYPELWLNEEIEYPEAILHPYEHFVGNFIDTDSFYLKCYHGQNFYYTSLEIFAKRK